MKKVIKSAEYDYTKTINYRKILLALNKMQELIDILDNMDDTTYQAFDNTADGDIYTLVSDSIQSITDGLELYQH